MTGEISLNLTEIARTIGGDLVGGDFPVKGITGLENARDDCLVWVEHARLLPKAEKTSAPAILAPQGSFSSTKSLVQVKNPRYAFAVILGLFHPQQERAPFIHPNASIHAGATIGQGVDLGAFAVVEKGAKIGARTVIFPGAYVGEDVRVGEDTVIHPGVVLYRGVEVGSRVIIHSGAVIGADGFGFVENEGKHFKIPQVGNVVIGDDVEIGANTCIDRATTGSTLIGKGTKIDNLVQIGHNCSIGENCIVVSQTGVAGSASIGTGAVLAAQSGIGPHVTVGDRAMVAGQAGVTKDVPPGAVVSGYPAKPHREAKRLNGYIDRLPDLFARMKELEAALRKIDQDQPAVRSRDEENSG